MTVAVDRRRSLVPRLVLAALCLAGSATARSAEPGSASSVRFPLHVSAGGRYLVDDRGAPFLIHGEAAWSLLARLTLEQTERYVTDRRQRGVNALIVNLLEHKFTDDPPRDAYGEAPFLVPGDFTTPNEAYFAHVDAALARLNEAGMLVFLFPAYLGYQGGDQGWFSEVDAMSVRQCRQYGRFVGARYGSLPNLVWVLGGDFEPPAWSLGAVCTLALAAGIRESAPEALMSGHWSPESASLDPALFAPLIGLDGVYTYRPAYLACDEARALPTPVPAFLFETTYEDEREGRSLVQRRQAYWADLTCGAGEIFGNQPIWLFDEGWQTALDSPGSRQMQRLSALFEGLPWQELVPDQALVVDGAGTYGSDRWVTAARTPDGRLAVLYVPAGDGLVVQALRPIRRLRLDLARMSAPVSVTFYDPTSGALRPGASTLLPNTGPADLATPGLNQDGDTDWAIVLRAD